MVAWTVDCQFLLIIIFFQIVFLAMLTCRALFCSVRGERVSKDSPHVPLFICHCIVLAFHQSIIIDGSLSILQLSK